MAIKITYPHSSENLYSFITLFITFCTKVRSHYKLVCSSVAAYDIFTSNDSRPPGWDTGGGGSLWHYYLIL